jgi:hypothetical protein
MCIPGLRHQEMASELVRDMAAIHLQLLLLEKASRHCGLEFHINTIRDLCLKWGMPE